MKERINYSGKKVSIGIDVHKIQYTATVVVEGIKVDVVTMVSSPEALITYVRRRYEGAEVRTAYEAGFSGFVLHRKLEASGIKSIVINAGSLAVASRDRVKTDKRDSLKIAMQLDLNQLEAIRVPSESEEASRILHRTRSQQVKHATRLRNQIRMKLYQFGYELSGKGFSGEKVRDLLKEKEVVGELKSGILSLLTLWEASRAEVAKFDKLLTKQALKDPLEERYRSLPGIGELAARTLSTEVGNLLQFSNERKLFSFVGLTPSEKSTGDSIRKGHITRQGSAELRKILVQSAWVAVRTDPWMKKEYERLSVRIGKRRAIVAIARKLIGKARALFRKNEGYCTPVSFAA